MSRPGPPAHCRFLVDQLCGQFGRQRREVIAVCDGCAVKILKRRERATRAEIPMPAREEKTVSMLYGADLKPGLYKLRAWLACTPPRDLHKLDAVLRIKGPTT